MKFVGAVRSPPLRVDFHDKAVGEDARPPLKFSFLIEPAHQLAIPVKGDIAVLGDADAQDVRGVG